MLDVQMAIRNRWADSKQDWTAW